MKTKNSAAVKLGRRGGRVTAKILTADQRRENARNAARARWGKERPLVEQTRVLTNDDSTSKEGDESKQEIEDALAFDVRNAGLASALNNLIGKKMADFMDERDYDFCVQNRIRLYAANSLDKLDSVRRERILSTLDRFIVEEARNIGPRILFSHAVRCRMVDWCETEGSLYNHLVQLAKAMTQYARVRRGLTKRPLRDQRNYAAKKEIVEELKLLQNKLRTELGGQSSFDGDGVRCLIAQIIDRKDYPFERLNANRTQFLEFLEVRWDDTKTWLTSQGVTSTQLADQFFAFDAGYKDSESARKAISRLGSKTHH
jgi:hypothetical protein